MLFILIPRQCLKASGRDLYFVSVQERFSCALLAFCDYEWIWDVSSSGESMDLESGERV